MIVRHDCSEAAFLIDASAFPAVCSLDDERARGIGTLIHPRFLLTAAHVAEKLRVGHSLTVAGTGHEVAAISLHPTWVDRSATDATENRLGFADLALLELRRPVRGVDAVPLFMQQAEPGQMVTLVGNGMSGTGISLLPGFRRDPVQIRRQTTLSRIRHDTGHFERMQFRHPGLQFFQAASGRLSPGEHLRATDDLIVPAVDRAASPKNIHAGCKAAADQFPGDPIGSRFIPIIENIGRSIPATMNPTMTPRNR